MTHAKATAGSYLWSPNASVKHLLPHLAKSLTQSPSSASSARVVRCVWPCMSTKPAMPACHVCLPGRSAAGSACQACIVLHSACTQRPASTNVCNCACKDAPAIQPAKRCVAATLSSAHLVRYVQPQRLVEVICSVRAAEPSAARLCRLHHLVPGPGLSACTCAAEGTTGRASGPIGLRSRPA